MKHYSSEECADFVRGAATASDSTVIQRHLDSGCQKCVSEMDFWRRVHDAARSQSAIEPPQSAVRIAKSLFAAARLHSSAAGKPTVARLLFDSMVAPIAAGIRSTATGPRQLLFGVGDHRIDLRMETKIDEEKVAIIGQVLDSTNPQMTLSNVPVSLHLGKKMLAFARTNGCGEFEFNCDLIGRLDIRATLPGGEVISIPVIEPATHPRSESPRAADGAKHSTPARETTKSSKRKV